MFGKTLGDTIVTTTTGGGDGAAATATAMTMIMVLRCAVVCFIPY